MAAGRTVEHGRVHSLHSYFLRPGDPTVPILYEVDRIRDGRVVHHPAGGGHPARAGHLQHGRLVPRRRERARAPVRDARRPAARGAGHPAGAPGAVARTSWPTGSAGPTPSTSATSATCPGSGPATRPPSSACGSGPTASCPTTRCSTPASPPTPRTCRSSTPSCSPTRSLGRRELHGGEPRPLHVVPPARSGPTSGCSTTPTHRWPPAARGLARGFLFDRSGRLVVSMVQEGLARLIG